MVASFPGRGPCGPLRPLRVAAIFCAALLGSVGPASAATAKIWTSDSTADFSAGEARGIAVTVNGELVLARPLARVEGISEAVLYDAVVAKDGTAFLGTGEAGRILRVSPSGKVETLATLTEKQVTALARGSDGALYAGASPGGKVYRIEGGKASLFYDTKAQYVWSLGFSGPALYVATGLPGEIHRVEASGRGQRVHAAPDPHVRTIHAAEDGSVWAGTSGSGLVLKLDRSGNVTTMFDSAKTEVTSIASGPKGRVWAAVSSSEGAGAGEPISAPAREPVRAPRPATPGEEGGDTPEKKPEVTVTVGAPRLAPARPPARTGFSSEIVLFEAGEPPRAVWTGSDEMVFSLGDADGSSVLAGTGPKGRLYRVSSDTWALERTFDEKQVTIVAGDAIATNGASAFYRLRTGENSGEYVAPVKDTGRTSAFGAFRFDGVVPAGSKLEVAFRSGESGAPDTTWSPWSNLTPAASTAKVAAPPGRFLQWKLRMSSSSNPSPVVRRVETAYRNRNSGPLVEAFFAMGPNEVFARSAGGGSNVFETTAPDEKGIFTSLDEAKGEAPPRKLLRKGYRTLTWKTTDPDGDALVHALAFRPATSEKWIPLESDVRESFYSFDTTSLPDGEYVFRLTAEDGEANPAEGKSASRETSPVPIDNTPPAIRRNGTGKGPVEFEVADAASPVTDVEYSVNAREWVRVEPKDGLSDSRTEIYAITLAPADRGGYLLVRATDAARNQTAASFTAP
jgi:hypothetical protein